jgi:hypothetical protein
MEQLPGPRGPAYQIRVEDVVTLKAEVSAKCGCGHEGPVDMFKVAGKYGRHARLADIEERVKCSKCRAKGMTSIKIVWKD